MSNKTLPPLRPPRPPSPPVPFQRSQSSQSQPRSDSSLSTTSNDASAQMPPPLSLARRSPYVQSSATARPSTAGGGPVSGSQSTISLQSTAQRQPARTSVDGGILRTQSPGNLHPHQQQQTHTIAARRQFSPGFFEPSLASQANVSSNGLTASQIAAQAAMHGISPPMGGGQERKRSHPGLSPIITGPPGGVPTIIRRQASDTSSPPLTAGLLYSNGTLGGNRLAATTAANVAFPNGRSPIPSPALQAQPTPPPRSQTPTFPPEKETKSKSSKMKIFSKAPKGAKEGKALQGAPSPSKNALSSTLLRSGFANASTTSLVGPDSSASSFYSTANASTSTLVPNSTEKEKEKRHNFLSRQKNKLKDEPSSLALSSAHSNSQPTNPDKPQLLYSFTPDSPGPTSFAKSMSGFDLRHGGRALREKKKEEKAAAAAARFDLTPTITNSSIVSGQTDPYGSATFDSLLGPASGYNASIFGFPSDTVPAVSAQAFSNIGVQMGIPGIGLDDAWPLLKARLLNIFSGEDLRTPIEDFNTLVTVHIRRCIQRKAPVVLIEDVRELLQTGFISLAQTLRGVPDDRLVPKFVEMWSSVYSTILPFLQAVFLPLDLEFKGRGGIMSVREAQEFWSGAMPESLKFDERPSSAGGTTQPPTMGEELDVRRITLISFRDTIILPKHEALMAIFSRLSLESINAGTPSLSDGVSRHNGREHARSDPTSFADLRPGTADSLSPHMSSYNSQSSTLLDAASTPTSSSNDRGGMNASARSRATSNTSAGSFGTNMPHINSPGAGSGTQGSFSTHQSTPPLASGAAASTTSALANVPSSQAYPTTAVGTRRTDPSKVTDTVARMLQCLSVLASCQTGDVGQGVVERLTGALKYNWLGRGRTGRNRRGWVGMKNPPRGIGGGGGGGAGLGIGGVGSGSAVGGSASGVPGGGGRRPPMPTPQQMARIGLVGA